MNPQSTNPLRFIPKHMALIEHVLLIALLSVLAALSVQQDLLWRWDKLLYDAQLSFWSRDVSGDIIIVAIDDQSLKELGRWPWPRQIHASLIERIGQESPAAIGLDIIFSEPDLNNPSSDQRLATAMQASGKVVLPVFMSQQSSNAYPIEALPLPEFTRQAAALGHVHIDIGDDGIARRVYLKEGIGKPHWLHYSLALLGITDRAVELERYLGSESGEREYSSMQWSREQPMLIPYAGPPGHFQQIGYAQALSGNYARDLFRDKIVLIGTTAEGLGDALPTPLAASGNSMPGVEIIANVIDAMLNNLRIIELPRPWLIAISVLLVALPLLIYPYLNPTSTLLVLFSVVSATLFAVALLLWLFGVWLPVSAILLLQVIGYPLWSWRRLEMAMRHIDAELNQLSIRQKALSMRRERNIADEIRFIGLFIPIKGWALLDMNGVSLIEQGTPPVCNLGRLKPTGWTVDGHRYWASTHYHNTRCRLGLSLGMDAVISDGEMRLLNSLVNTPLSDDADKTTRSADVLRKKIRQVQSVGSEYEELRRIVDDSLSAMADGVLICSSRGQVMLSNRRAAWYLYANDHAPINGKSINEVLAPLQVKEGGSWAALMQPVLFRQERVLTHAQHESGRDLMVELSPLRIIGDEFDGFVVNMSDISLLKASERKRNQLLDFLSHDLRSPLSSMIAMIELAKNKNSLGELRGMLTVMEKNTHKTLHLAEQFLQLSRANTSESIPFYDIDFNSVVLNAIDQLWGLSKKTGVTVGLEFDNDECWTHAEPDLLERAIVNLLSNAIKFSPAGSEVKLIVTQNRSEISCCVIDQGTGISMDELPHLFEMFRRVQGAGVERKQGIGLGLAFVDAVAKRHSGHVDVESQLGVGSSFCLRIPRVDLLDPLNELE